MKGQEGAKTRTANSGARTPDGLRSMTGYARATGTNEAFEVTAEIRSVNHRFLDLRVRAPASIATLERQIRERVNQAMSRGKVDVNVHLKPRAESAYELEVDGPMLAELIEKAGGLAEEHGVSGEISTSDLVGFSPAFRVKERDLSTGVGLWEALQPVLDEALGNMEQMRAAEGKEMRVDLDARIQTIAGHVDRIEVLSEASREVKRQQLQQKVEEILESAVEPAAMAMEVAKLVERSDIAEEITRFRSHLTLWTEAAATPGPCGKKLDFIVQEMNREVNTIGSKCQDAEMTENVIAIKSELERVREQVQNIE